jgi:acyl-CoA thioesterase-2
VIPLEPVAPAPFALTDLIALLRLRRDGSLRFRGDSPTRGTTRVYGGQMLAQSIMAMGQTVPANHVLHSMHGYFLQPGDIHEEIVFDVEAIRDGRNFSTRLVTASQRGRAIFTGMSSFQIAEGDGHRRLRAIPEVSAPEALEGEDDFIQRQRLYPQSRTLFAPFFISLIERRSAAWRPLRDPGVRSARNGLWCRLRGTVECEPLMHHALVAYISDLDLMGTAMRPRGIGMLDPRAAPSSLDHAMWFHAPVRADEWFYYDLDGPCAVNNRGLGMGAVYQGGERVISAAQEGLLRLSPPD